MHLGIRACSAVLPRGLYYYNLLLLERPFYLNAIAFYKVSIEFLFGYYKFFKRGIVYINKRYKLII